MKLIYKIISLIILAFLAGLLVMLLFRPHEVETKIVYVEKEVFIDVVKEIPVNHYITQCRALKTPIESSEEWDEKVIENRLEKAHKELRACIWYDYIVVNEDIHQSVGEVESIIISERCRRENRLPMVKEIFGMEF